MLKAVFFDWFNTLAAYYPLREELQSQAIREFGFSVSPENIKPALHIADELIFEANAVSPVRLRSPEEQARIYTRYQETLMKEAGIGVPDNPDIVRAILKRANELFRNIGFRLYDDVLPVLENLKKRRLIIGIITNLDIDMRPVCSKLGLDPFLDGIFTSGEVGFDKPQPEIFHYALKAAGISAGEAIHVGDQYRIDALGAAGAGIRPVIIDRYDLYPEISDYPRIRTLGELYEYL